MGRTAVISMPSENGRRAIAMRREPIWTTVIPRFSISMKSVGIPFCPFEDLLREVAELVLADRLVADLHEFHVVDGALLCCQAGPAL